MQWVRGNRAIRGHARDGKDLLLFEMAAKGHVRFLGEFACAGYEVTEAPDTDAQIREAFIFDLVPIDDLDNVVSESEWPPASDLSDLHRRALEAAASEKQADAKSAKRNVYERSAAVREYILARAAGRCDGCGSDAPFITKAGQPYLEPHHIRRLSDGGPDHPASWRRYAQIAIGGFISEKMVTDITCRSRWRSESANPIRLSLRPGDC